jgi:hypothetical protein
VLPLPGGAPLGTTVGSKMSTSAAPTGVAMAPVRLKLSASVAARVRQE